MTVQVSAAASSSPHTFSRTFFSPPLTPPPLADSSLSPHVALPPLLTPSSLMRAAAPTLSSARSASWPPASAARLPLPAPSCCHRNFSVPPTLSATSRRNAPSPPLPAPPPPLCTVSTRSSASPPFSFTTPPLPVRDEAERTAAEKRILQVLHHPFVSTLFTDLETTPQFCSPARAHAQTLSPPPISKLAASGPNMAMVIVLFHWVQKIWVQHLTGK